MAHLGKNDDAPHQGGRAKTQIVEAVARDTHLSLKQAELIVETFFRRLVNALSRGETIELRGFGSFRIRSRGAREGRNPKTGERVSVPAKRVPYFKPGKELRGLLNS